MITSSNYKSKETIDQEINRVIHYMNARHMEKQENDVLYHYTNIEALYNGILVKEPKSEEECISLFATDYRYLNDKNEIQYGLSALEEIYCDRYRLSLSSNSGNKIGTNYIISFSEEKDSIPMWSTYGKKGDGIALGFDFEILNDKTNSIQKCLYSNKDIKKQLLQTLAFVDYQINLGFGINQTVRKYIMLNIAQYLKSMIKHSGYEYEKEFRLVIKNTKDYVTKYRYSNNLIIPYVVKYLPKAALKKIIIGPNLNTERTRVSLKEYLDSKGFEDVIIESSNVPFRSL